VTIEEPLFVQVPTAAATPKVLSTAKAPIATHVQFWIETAARILTAVVVTQPLITFAIAPESFVATSRALLI
jgi:hypothetical protein